jgi:hypothetical protein
MSKQIFKKLVPPSVLYELFEQICLKTDKYYLVDHNSYKKFLYYDLDKKLCADLVEYYHLSKHFYLTREMTYNSFTNLVRQICKSNGIMFTNQIKYNESKYTIEYLVYP